MLFQVESLSLHWNEFLEPKSQKSKNKMMSWSKINQIKCGKNGQN